MRVIAGQFGGRKLAHLGKGDAGAHLRPTTDRVREALFSHLMGGHHGDPITGARVLDLFAGTGALGFEALSRGAAHITFVEDGRVGARLISENQRALDVVQTTTLLRRNALRLPTATAACDLIFLDPPYGKGLGEKALQVAWDTGWMAPGALIVWEEAAEMPAPEGFTPLSARSYGGTVITLLRAPAP